MQIHQDVTDVTEKSVWFFIHNTIGSSKSLRHALFLQVSEFRLHLDGFSAIGFVTTEPWAAFLKSVARGHNAQRHSQKDRQTLTDDSIMPIAGHNACRSTIG